MRTRQRVVQNTVSKYSRRAGCDLAVKNRNGKDASYAVDEIDPLDQRVAIGRRTLKRQRERMPTAKARLVSG